MWGLMLSSKTGLGMTPQTSDLVLTILIHDLSLKGSREYVKWLVSPTTEGEEDVFNRFCDAKKK